MKLSIAPSLTDYGILSLKDMLLVDSIARNMSTRDIEWIVKFERDREHSLGSNYLKYDSHAKKDKVLQSELKKLISFTNFYELQTHPDLESYYEKVLEIVTDDLRKLKEISYQILEFKETSPSLETLYEMMKKFSYQNEVDNAIQMLLSGDRWKYSFYFPILGVMVAETGKKFGVTEKRLISKIKRFLINPAKISLLNNEKIPAVKIQKTLFPVFLVADDFQKRIYFYATKSLKGYFFKSTKQLVNYYIHNNTNFDLLKSNGIVPLFCFEEFQLRRKLKSSTAKKILMEFFRDNPQLEESSILYLKLKNLENISDVFEYRSMFTFASAVLYLYSYKEIKKISNSIAKRFYDEAISDSYTESLSIYSSIIGGNEKNDKKKYKENSKQ